jgi:hypothetical protein
VFTRRSTARTDQLPARLDPGHPAQHLRLHRLPGTGDADLERARQPVAERSRQPAQGDSEARDHGVPARFVEGAGKNGCAEQVAREIWDNIVKFGGYSFNKSHSTATPY